MKITPIKMTQPLKPETKKVVSFQQELFKKHKNMLKYNLWEIKK